MVGGQTEEEEAEETGGLLFAGGSLAVTALLAIALREAHIHFGKRMALLRQPQSHSQWWCLQSVRIPLTSGRWKKPRYPPSPGNL